MQTSNINRKIDQKVAFLSIYIAFMCMLAPPVQAATPINSYDKPFAIAAIAFNLPYPLYWLCSKNEKFHNRLLYGGNVGEAVWNHSLNVIDFVALSSALPAKSLFLAGAILAGLQTCMYSVTNAYGVSLVWSGLTGMLLHRLWIQKEVKWHLCLAMLLNSATLAYYAYNAPAITTIAHVGGVVGGFGLSFLLP